MSETDWGLISRYVRDHADDAFAAIVRRYVDLVYSAALRQVRTSQLAEEEAQSTFIDLARSAAKLAPDTILTAWLYKVASRTAVDVIRRESRRHRREQIAHDLATMNATPTDWGNIEPLLDETMNALGGTDPPDTGTGTVRRVPAGTRLRLSTPNPPEPSFHPPLALPRRWWLFRHEGWDRANVHGRRCLTS